MSHPDLKRTFEEIFSDCWYDVIRQAGIALNQEQIDVLRTKCDKAAHRISVRLEMQAMVVCDALQKRVAEGFEKVQADVAALAKDIEELKSPALPEEENALPKAGNTCHGGTKK